MERENVQSSNLASVGYDSEQTLEVQFKHGRIYQYTSVPESIYNGLMNASSHGKYFDAYIKKVGYLYTKVG